VELNEAARRIFLQHWWLIAVGVIAGAAVGAVLAGSANGYRASARMVIDSPDPTVTSQSTAIADTVRAIATSPALLRQASASVASTTNQSVRLDQSDVSVAPLGTSGVLSLAVTAPSRKVAAKLADALANEVIQTRLHIADGQTELDRTKLGARIDSLSSRIAKLDRSIAAVTGKLAGASAARQGVLQTELGNLSQQRDFLTQQRGVLQSEQASLIPGSAGRPTPTVISPAIAGSAKAAGGSPVSKAVLGALLGLVLALVSAALIEAFRPTLVGGEAVAQALGKPHLGSFSVDGSGRLGPLHGSDVTSLLRESAQEAGVADIDLLGIGSTVDLELIAGALDSAFATRGAVAAASGEVRALSSRITVRPFGLRAVARGKGTGLAVIAPAILKKSELVEAMDFLRTTPWPVLGVLTYKPTRVHWWSSLVARRSVVETAEGGTPMGKSAGAMRAG
jgi:capsular polysaccharide biosynthesis protein